MHKIQQLYKKREWLMDTEGISQSNVKVIFSIQAEIPSYIGIETPRLFLMAIVSRKTDLLNYLCTQFPQQSTADHQWVTILPNADYISNSWWALSLGYKSCTGTLATLVSKSASSKGFDSGWPTFTV